MFQTPHYTFRHSRPVGSIYTHTKRTGFSTKRPFYSRVKDQDCCSQAGTPSLAPAPPEPSLRGAAPGHPSPIPVAASPAGLSRAADRLHPRAPRKELRRYRGTARAGHTAPGMPLPSLGIFSPPLPLPAAPRRPGAACAPPSSGRAGSGRGLPRHRRRCARERAADSAPLHLLAAPDALRTHSA